MEKISTQKEKGLSQIHSIFRGTRAEMRTEQRFLISNPARSTLKKQYFIPLRRFVGSVEDPVLTTLHNHLCPVLKNL